MILDDNQTGMKLVSKCPFSEGMKLFNFSSGARVTDTLHTKAPQFQSIKCDETKCVGSLMAGQSTAPKERTKEEIIQQARNFQEQFHQSKKSFTSEDIDNRMNDIIYQIKESGFYELTLDELQFGAKLAWRNAPRCIGRIQWNKLEVQDCRKISTTREMFDALCNHLDYATNNGNIRSMITVFPPRRPGCEDFRMWNPQLLNFAGYLQPDGAVTGDPARVLFTRICQRLGWKGKGGQFDILPWVIYAPEDGLNWYEIPEQLILKVKLEHPRYDWFADMDINWYAVPAVADMLFDCGGLAFPAAPFNGWYMGTEIGARNLCDPQRYNLTQTFAEKMGLDTSSPVTLWKDTVLVEVNLAVLYSFRKQQVTIVDHHTASETFIKHIETEQKLRGGCPSDWVWIVPPISGSITPVFHQEMICYNLKPSYEYQEKAWTTYQWPKNSDISLKYSFATVARCAYICTSLMSKVRTSRVLATILYATETGKSETLARRLERLLLTSFNVEVKCMEDYDIDNLRKEQLMIFVVSTFGSGEPPDNGKGFWHSLKKLKGTNSALLSNIKYAVFALGSSQYPNFCKFGKNLDELLQVLGSCRILDVKLGDELRGQVHTFNAWLPEIYQVACKKYDIEVSENATIPMLEVMESWDPKNFRLTKIENIDSNFIGEISRLHNKNVFSMHLLSNARLQASYSDNQTLLVRLDTKDSTSLKYKPGDHMGVFPSNPPDVVDVILKHFQNADYNTEEGLQIDTLKDGKWSRYSRLPPASLRTYFTKYLDITSPPTPHLLQMMAETATNHWDKYRLKRFAQVTDDFEEWKNFHYPNLAEVLEEFPSLNIDASLFLSELPLLQPRYYSISSSPSLNKNQVHLTVSLVKYRTQDNKGPIHRGVCTSFFNSSTKENIPCFIRSAVSFHMPDNPSTPIIMIGAGSGIAPFRSFWQHREFQKAAVKDETHFGKIVLFFGCRKANVDNIYEQETNPLVRKGILTKVFTAFSREEGKPKCYVQHEILKQADLVWEMMEKDGHIYVCGDAVIANDVRLTLNSILREKLQTDVETLIESNRYHEDVFGILHKK